MRLHQGQTNQTANRMKDKRGYANYVMYPQCCSCPSIFAISYLSLVLLTPPSLPVLLTQPAPASPSPPLRGPLGAELFRPTFSDGD